MWNEEKRFVAYIASKSILYQARFCLRTGKTRPAKLRLDHVRITGRFWFSWKKWAGPTRWLDAADASKLLRSKCQTRTLETKLQKRDKSYRHPSTQLWLKKLKQPCFLPKLTQCPIPLLPLFEDWIPGKLTPISFSSGGTVPAFSSPKMRFRYPSLMPPTFSLTRYLPRFHFTFFLNIPQHSTNAVQP